MDLETQPFSRVGSCLPRGAGWAVPAPSRSSWSPLRPGPTSAVMGTVLAATGLAWPLSHSVMLGSMCPLGQAMCTQTPGRMPPGGACEAFLDEVSPGQGGCPQPGTGLGPVQSRRGRQSLLPGPGRAPSALLRLRLACVPCRSRLRPAPRRRGPSPRAGAFRVSACSPSILFPRRRRAPPSPGSPGGHQGASAGCPPPTLLPEARPEAAASLHEERKGARDPSLLWGTLPVHLCPVGPPPTVSLCSLMSLAAL